MSTVEEIKPSQVNTDYAPNYDFIKSRVITVKDFYGTLFVQFAKYRANQRIPRLDGLNETQRKILWTALNKSYSKKTKLIQVMADVNLISNYHHGQDSMAGTLNNIIASYKNNLCMLKPDGSFGSRSVKQAAAYRYTETRVYNYLKKLFPMEDIIATKAFRIVDGLPAEPLTLLPIIPLGIINGQSQAAVGFSTNLLPRDPIVIIDLFLDILTGKVTNLPGYIKPSYPMFTGEVKLIDKNHWELRGRVSKFKKGKKEIINIEEVPPSWTRKSIIKLFDKYKESGLIDNYTESCKGDSFNIEVIAPKLFNLPEDTIIDKLKLYETEKERFVYIASDEGVDEKGNPDGKIKDRFEIECASIAQYLNYFIKKRIAIYEERKKYRMAKQLWEIQRLVAMVNYINEVNAGRIEIRNKEEEEVIEQLQKYSKDYNFIPMTEKFIWDPIELKLSRTNYNYLFDFTTRNFTPKAINKLLEKISNLNKEFIDIQKETGAGLWYRDLLDFKEDYLKTKKEYEAAVKKLKA